jgi:hypothetical protein
MDRDESRDLLMHSFNNEQFPSAARSIIDRTGGWPLLLSLVNRALVDCRLNNVTLESAFRQIDDQLGRWGPIALDVGSPTDRSRAVEAAMRVSLDLLNQHFPEGEQRFLELGNIDSLILEKASLEKYWADTAGLSARETHKLCRQLNELSLVRYNDGYVHVVSVIHEYLRHRLQR